MKGASSSPLPSPKNKLPQRLAAALLLEISSGNYTEGGRFLSCRKIMSKWGVSHQTATLATARLREWGLIKTERRSGHYLQKDCRQMAMLLLESNRIALPVQPSWLNRARNQLNKKKSLKRIAVIVQFDWVPQSYYERTEALLEGLSGYYFTRSAQAIARMGQKHEIDVSFHAHNGKDSDSKRLLREIQEYRPQGVIILKRILQVSIQSLAHLLLKKGIPVVVMFNDCADTDLTSINFNNVAMGYTALEKLAIAGHRRIGVSLFSRKENSLYFKDRLAGCELAVQELSLPVDLQAFTITEHYAEKNEGFFELFALDNPNRLSALFAPSADMLSWLLPAFEKARVDIPKNLSIITCSTTQKIPLFERPIDILKIDFDRIGSEAFGILLALYFGKPTQKITLLDPSYHAYGSVMPTGDDCALLSSGC